MKIHVLDKVDGIGNSYGYSTHQGYLYNAMQNEGVKFDNSSSIALHIKPLLHYERILEKKNIVYTMYEYETLPENWIQKLSEIDLLVVPCEHNKKLFERYTSTPIAICQEGVDSQFYSYQERSFPADRPFRFYHFSVNNPRKGYPLVFLAWDAWTNIFPHLRDKTELYVKASNGKTEMIEHDENIYFDNRNLSRDELRKLNDSAHAFLFPSMGEGWGLTLIEAAATGLPCLYTDHSGPKDYMDNSTGYPLNFEMVKVRARERDPKTKEMIFHESSGAWVTMQSMIGNMYKVYTEYDDALQRGKKAAEYLKQNFTWKQSAQKLINIIKEHLSNA